MSSELAQSTPGLGSAAHAQDLVVLMDAFGQPSGTYDRSRVHSSDTPLHLAFSSYLFDEHGQVLLTRRALNKTTWPGVWTNSCCGHPRPGETIEDAIRRRIAEELGVGVSDLTPVLPDFRYRAVDSSGLVENEICPVYAARIDPGELSPDPNEVAATYWGDWADLVSSSRRTPFLYSPWCAQQVSELRQRLPRRFSSPSGTTRITGNLTDCIHDVDELLTAEMAALEQRWGELDQGQGPDILGDDLPGWLNTLLVGQGKRLRVAMAYWGFIAAGGNPRGTAYQNLVRIGAALEALHLFGLVQDDVMDESHSRRGAPSAHLRAATWHRDAGGRGDAHRFGENLAILLGDLAHTVADRLVDSLPEDVRRLWYDLCIELLAGQRADLTGAAAGRRDMSQATHLARLKSGCYTIERPLQLGATAAGADQHTVDILGRCGTHIGTAFALRDDHLGIWGDPSVTGKPAGDDLAEAKATVILALAGEHLTGEAADALDRLGTEALRSTDVDLVRTALEASGIPARIESLIAAEVEAASSCLDASGLTHNGITGLKAAAHTVAWRDS